MAFSRRGMGDDHPGVGPAAGLLSKACLITLRWVAFPCIAATAVALSAATLAGLHSAASLAYANASFVPAALSLQPQPAETAQRKPAAIAHRMLVAPVERPVRVASLTVKREKPRAAEILQPPADPFGKVVAGANLSREKLLAAFARAGMAVAGAADEAESVELALAMPIAERFHRAEPPASLAPSIQPEVDPLSTIALGRTGLPVELAYAAVEANAGDPVELALASLGDAPLGMDYGADAEEMPDSVELPSAKPEPAPGKPAAGPAKADVAKPARKPTETADEPARKPSRSERQEPQQALAYARPEKPEGNVNRAFRNLFNNTPKAGNKVAIYDISAAVVHMPDGSKLEAHSGIGKMADNPRYVHVKMNGPTPPNTYKLSMREKRFHGVEAVRMTPVGDQTMHGRDGILAHSYLLRGGREESHGCVAFANYPKFLKAFKQGKVTHMVVVPSISKANLRLVSNGRGA